MKDFADFLWVFQAYFRGKVLQQRDYQFRISGEHVEVPSIKTTGKRINRLSKWNGYMLLDVGSIRWMLSQKILSLEGCSSYLVNQWQEHRDWPRIGRFIEGEGTHGEAYIADPPHFLIIKR
jgi:hypothetical protein